MYNRYKGNSGKVIRVDDKQPSAPRPPAPKKPQYPVKSAPPLFMGLLQKLIPNTLSELETEDLLLILILYLMYRESGDKELLIIIGAMYLL